MNLEVPTSKEDKKTHRARGICRYPALNYTPNALLKGLLILRIENWERLTSLSQPILRHPPDIVRDVWVPSLIHPTRIYSLRREYRQQSGTHPQMSAVEAQGRQVKCLKVVIGSYGPCARRETRSPPRRVSKRQSGSRRILKCC